MNLASPWNAPSKILFRIAMKCRRLLSKKRSQAFGHLSTKESPRIERIYVINLNRQPARWAEMQQELRHVLDWSGVELWNLTERYAAVDANHFMQEPLKDADIDPIYTLGDQLFVEPQPLALPTRLELNSPIQMSQPEIAVARSHIGIWRQVAASTYSSLRTMCGFDPGLPHIWTRRGAKSRPKVTGKAISTFSICPTRK